MPYFGEVAGQIGTDALGWRIGLGAFGMPRFQLLEFVEESVILRVRDHWLVAHMIKIDMMMQFGAQFSNALLDVVAHLHCPVPSEIVLR